MDDVMNVLRLHSIIMLTHIVSAADAMTEMRFVGWA